MEDKTRIRMRAYDYINKEMHYNFQCIWVKSSQEDEIASGLIFSSDLFTPSFEKWPPEVVPRKFEIMEWLHAVDEMNMPIYMFDIINVKQDGKEWTGITSWGSKGCAICWDINSVVNGRLTKCCFFDEPKTSFSIIGNAFENMPIIKHLIDAKIFNFPIIE